MVIFEPPLYEIQTHKNSTSASVDGSGDRFGVTNVISQATSFVVHLLQSNLPFIGQIRLKPLDDRQFEGFEE
jgi:hypothetical protein